MQTHTFTALGCDFVRYSLGAGEKLERHVHAVDHLTVVAAGRVKVTTDAAQLFVGPLDKPILFRAGRHHEVEAMEPTVLMNVFSGNGAEQ